MDKEYKIENKDNITGNMKLKLDKDFNTLMDVSQKTGVPITFMGDRIVDFKINNFSEFESFKPDKIVIGPTATLFDIKFGDDSFNNIPFDKLKITENIILFKTSSYANFDVALKIRLNLENFDEKKGNVKFSLTSKSNKIEDVLKYELFKKKYNGSKFEINLSNLEELLFDGNLPNIGNNDDFIYFFNKINKINQVLNLNIHIDENYIITKKDDDVANFVCEFIKNKKVKINTLKIDLKINSSQLEEILNNNQQFILEQNNYSINLLNNTIDLGFCQISIKEYELLNKEELSNLLKINKNNEEKINVKLILRSVNNDLYLNFK